MKIAREIIEEVLEKTGLKPGTFANSIGKQPQNIYDITNGKVKKISFEMANLIANKYPEFNIDYLQTGNGNLLNKKPLKGVPDNEIAIGVILEELASLRAQIKGTIYTDEKDALLDRIAQLGGLR